jgi:hypothetical protein
MFIICLIFETSSRHLKLCSRAKSTTVVVLVEVESRCSRPSNSIQKRVLERRMPAFVRFQDLTAASMKMTVMWDVALWSHHHGDGGRKHLWNNGLFLPDYILDVSHLNAYLSSDGSLFVLTPEWVLSSDVTCICAYYPPVQIAGWAETSRGRTSTFI